jgi:hypothetical protein
MANLIQIKRSLNTATPGSLANGEMAYTANGDALFIGSNGAVVAVGGKRTPGTLTANQALVANATSYLDAIKVANATIDKIYANGAHGTTGQIVTSNSTGGLFWSTPSPSVTGSNTQLQFNDEGAANGAVGVTFDKNSNTLNIANVVSVGANVSLSTTTLLIGNSTVNSTVNSSSLTVNNATISNAILTKVYANGAFGSDGQVLTSNSTGGVFFAAPVTNLDGLSDVAVAAASSGQVLIANSTGFFRNVSVSGDITISDTGVVAIAADSVALGTDTSGNYVAEITAGNGLSGNAASEGSTPTIAVVAGGGIVSNSTGVFANTDNSTLELSGGAIRVKDDGIALGTKTTGNYVATITAGNGLSGNATTEGSAPTIAVVAGSGIASNSTGVFVVAGTGVTSNATGVHIGQAVGTTDNVTFANVSVSNTLTVTGFSDLANGDIGDIKFRGSNVISGSFDANILDLGLGAAILTGGNFGVEIKYSNNRTNFYTTTFDKDSGAILAPANINAASFTVGTNFIANSTLVTVDKDITINGNTVIGSNSSDRVTVNAQLSSSIIPSANITYSLGNNTLRFLEVHAQNAHSEFLYVDKDVEISGNLTVSGSLVTINVSTLAVTDSLIQLASNNTTTDTLDIGLFGNYNVGGGAHEHAGLFRDASTDTWKLFKGLQDAPTTVVNVSGTGYTQADLEAYLISGGLVSNSSAVTLTANSTVAVSITANTISLSTALPGGSGGTGLASFTTEDILVANSSNGFRKLAVGANGYVLQVVGGAVAYGTLDGGSF